MPRREFQASSGTAGTLQYTSEPAVEHIAWENAGDAMTLTLLPLPPNWGSIAFNLAVLIATVVIIFHVDPTIGHSLSLLIFYGVIGLDAVFRFLRDRKPIVIRLDGQKLTASGGQLLKNHAWNLWEIREVRAPISGFNLRGEILSAIQISPQNGRRVTVGSGRRLREMDWAVKKLRRAMTMAGWPGARRKSRSRRLGEWVRELFHLMR